MFIRTKTSRLKKSTRNENKFLPPVIVWIAFLGMHGYYFLLDYWNTPHPSYLPLFSLIAVQVIALLLAVCLGVWRLVRKPQRLKTAAWLSLGFLPVFLWYSQVSLTFHSVADRVSPQVEMSWFLVTTQSIAAALLDGVGRWTLPHKLEGNRVVMFYDSVIADPQGDLEKMDAFIKSEEQYLGRTMSAKIHWMRAPLFGMPGYALASIAVARPGHFSGDETCIDPVDYHEAAHNIMPAPPASAVYAGRYPPSFLTEGGWLMLAEESWKLKQSNKSVDGS